MTFIQQGFALRSSLMKLLALALLTGGILLAGVPLAVADEMFSITFKEVYLAQNGKWGLRFILKNNYPDKDILSISSWKGEYLYQGEPKPFSISTEYTLKKPLPPGKTVTFDLTLRGTANPRDISDVNKGTYKYTTRPSSAAQKTHGAAQKTPTPPAQKQQKYIENMRAMNPNDNYILWGLLSISKVNDYNWKVVGHIINNHKDREIIAILDATMVYTAGSQGYDRGVRKKKIDKLIFQSPIKPGEKLQLNTPINDTNVQSFYWENVRFETRKVQGNKQSGGKTTVIINN